MVRTVCRDEVVVLDLDGAGTESSMAGDWVL